MRFSILCAPSFAPPPSLFLRLPPPPHYFFFVLFRKCSSATIFSSFLVVATIAFIKFFNRQVKPPHPTHPPRHVITSFVFFTSACYLQPEPFRSPHYPACQALSTSRTLFLLIFSLYHSEPCSTPPPLATNAAVRHLSTPVSLPLRTLVWMPPCHHSLRFLCLLGGFTLASPTVGCATPSFCLAFACLWGTRTTTSSLLPLMCSYLADNCPPESSFSFSICRCLFVYVVWC